MDGLMTKITDSSGIWTAYPPLDYSRLFEVAMCDALGLPWLLLALVVLAAALCIGRWSRQATPEAQLRLALRVLVVEDDPIHQVALREQLERLGCEVTVADDGAEALACWDIRPHDLVLTDLRMPYLDGYALAQRLRAEGVGCPIIGVTATAMADEERRCRDAGMNTWLAKPIALQTLEHMLEEFTPRSARPAEGARPTKPLPVPPDEPDVLQVHRAVFMQCMHDDLRTLARSLDEGLPELAIHALHRMRGALLLARLQSFAARTEHLERQIHANGLDENLRVQLASALVDLRALLDRL